MEQVGGAHRDIAAANEKYPDHAMTIRVRCIRA